jgi:hypothetical protein
MDLDSVIGWLTDVVRFTGSVVCRSDELLLRSFDSDFADLERREREINVKRVVGVDCGWIVSFHHNIVIVELRFCRISYCSDCRNSH